MPWNLLTLSFPGNVQTLLGMEHAALQAYVWRQMVPPAGSNQSNALATGQRPPQNQNNGQGSQANPVDITTPQIPGSVLNANIPSFAQQPGGTFAPPPPPQRQPSSSGPTSGQTNPQQWSQQAGQSGQPQPGSQTQQSPNRNKVWASHDFRTTNFPIAENKMPQYIAQSLGQPIEGFAPPSIQNKVVDLFSLFNIVHKNGGSVKVSPQNIVCFVGLTPLAREQHCHLVYYCRFTGLRRDDPVWPRTPFVAPNSRSNGNDTRHLPVQARRYVLHINI